MAAAIGNNYSGKHAVLETSLRSIVREDDGKRIRQGCEKLLDQFAEGDLPAFNAVSDRIDGKPGQSIEMNVTKEAQDYSREELIERIGTLRRAIEVERGLAETGSSEKQPSELH